ncbi:hypothetical protein Bp8pC_032 [Bacillus phage Bp8p-C]|uniref:Uncharacterized protein n=2 Tax=Agatevirus Bp8pC TaxID=1910937 RepID=A0A0A0PJ28_9CAUD|nr:hypothetical protein AXJ20_gp032 [Bacillus phage Bp8p-C]YP_009784333.1 hypothetical protein QLX39_gp032 [Bacillus phage Bp8p-T]AHJ87463.1 hypothetical protein Bp8pC_032 [Bacillus phage Bp8p-C]AHJ87674.1 hypothetical protein Bp8pT_032 [Bacillus phage Bp8p-T]
MSLTLLLPFIAIAVFVFLVDVSYDLAEMHKAEKFADAFYHVMDVVKSVLAVIVLVYIGITII